MPTGGPNSTRANIPPRLRAVWRDADNRDFSFSVVRKGGVWLVHFSDRSGTSAFGSGATFSEAWRKVSPN